MASETKPEPTDEERADAQIREKERERDEAFRKRIAKEAAVYASVFDQIRLRLEPFIRWGEHFEDATGRVVTIPEGTTFAPTPPLRVVKDPPLLSGSDLKDAATSVYINLSRGISWR